MNTFQLLAFSFAGVGSVMVYLWYRQKQTKNAGTVDVAWAFSFGVVALVYAFLLPEAGLRKFIVAGLTLLWSLRLGFYLHRRVAGKKEDGRYSGLREKWGDAFEQKILIFFLFQALTVSLLSSAFLVAMRIPDQFGQSLFDIVGAAIIVVAIVGEHIADSQLENFKKNSDNQGGICDVGLWKYSRHPNYFFEWLHWLGYPFLAIGSSALWVPILVAASMLFFILKMTGIPATEEHMLRSRGEPYRKYQARTNAFFPWFPRKPDNN